MAMVILPLFLLLLPMPFVAALWQWCGDSGNYTSNSTYQANLMRLSSTLPKKAVSYTTLFATDTVGNVPDLIYALALCRGDYNTSACKDCVATAFQEAQQLCPYSKDVTIYDDPCMLRFSNQNFIATTVDDGVLILMNTQNITTSVSSFNLYLFTLMNNTAQAAANSSRRFTTSRLDVSSSPTLYCLMQCRPDLTTGDCLDCFQVASEVTLKYMDGRQGGRVLGTQCNIRYEMYPFFYGDPMLRIINLATEVPATNSTTPGSTPVTVYGSPPPAPAASAPPPIPVVQTTVEQHGM
jgi:hypothetical protein